MGKTSGHIGFLPGLLCVQRINVGLLIPSHKFYINLLLLSNPRKVLSDVPVSQEPELGWRCRDFVSRSTKDDTFFELNLGGLAVEILFHFPIDIIATQPRYDLRLRRHSGGNRNGSDFFLPESRQVCLPINLHRAPFRLGTDWVTGSTANASSRRPTDFRASCLRPRSDYSISCR